MKDCLGFVNKEILRLALMEKNEKKPEQITNNVPLWISGAIKAYKESQTCKHDTDIYPSISWLQNCGL